MATPREHYLGPGPWKVFTLRGYIQTPSDDAAFVYQDVVVALDEERRINNGQPTLHALCLAGAIVAALQAAGLPYFDLTDPPTQHADVVTFSYGEPISSGHAIDFSPFVVRAEVMARSYHGLLQTFGEAGSPPFRIRHREWFLASQTFVTIHICFDP
jgi:hypothetical protein